MSRVSVYSVPAIHKSLKEIITKISSFEYISQKKKSKVPPNGHKHLKGLAAYRFSCLLLGSLPQEHHSPRTFKDFSTSAVDSPQVLRAEFPQRYSMS
jgi:hypothetical protein